MRANKGSFRLKGCQQWPGSGQHKQSLKQAKDQGTLRGETDISRLAHFIIAGFEGALMMGKLRKDPDVVAGVIEELKEHLAQYRIALSPMMHV